MRGELIAIDLETTGLDQETDAIIEVGAVRLIDGQVVDEYSTLVNPGRPIPEAITLLTGISDEDFHPKLHKAGEQPIPPVPSINEVLPAVRTFVGNATVVGHNVGFDLGFLRRHGILQNNLWIDTYELAAVLLPRAPRYNLASLSSLLNIELTDAHRALHDARASGLAYWALWQKALQIPPVVLAEIINAAQGMDWNATPVFEEALRELGGTGFAPTSFMPLPFKPAVVRKPLRNESEAPKPVKPETLVEMMTVDGPLAANLPGYKPRPQQIEMAKKVAQAFNDASQIMIEAGTGTGKSLAYLLPAILASTLNDERVVISTNTINLQEQLITKDIPAISAAIGIPFEVALLKGRDNYLCPRRLETVRRRHPTHIDELRLLAKILIWMLESDSGDKGEISLRGPAEHSVWSRLSAADEGCTTDRCETAMEGKCPFYKARKAAESAHLVVVNHALLVSDALANNQVLPEYQRLIIDEAHHLEDAATNSLNFRIDESALRRRLADLGNTRRGLLGELLSNATPRIPEKDLTRLTGFIKNISAATSGMEAHVQNLFIALRGFADDTFQRMRSNEHLPQIRLTAETRPRMNDVRSKWGILKEYFEVIGDALARLNDGLGRIKPHNIPNHDDIANSLAAAAGYLSDIKNQLHAILAEPADNMIYWMGTGQGNGYITLHSAPLNVGTSVSQNLWEIKKTVVMTSATLRTKGTFDFMRERLRADNFDAVEYDSPFDYLTSTLLYIPNDIPDPNDRLGYQHTVERALIELAAALNGRVLALFTSYAQLRQTAQVITPRLALGNITVYDQIEGNNRQALVEGFKLANRAVLMGTRSLWEGIDIPGDSLSGLVITRLPFSVPSEPVFASRAETYSDPFNDYNLPDAILRFRQGFGRLIRSQTDRGVVVILDRRLTSKGYGQDFLDSIPECTIQHGSLQALPDLARRWLKQD